MACIALVLEKPAAQGEFRVFNQFTESFSVNQLADQVKATFGGKPTISHLDDPRVEAQEHYYNAQHTKLMDLGLHPHLLTEEVIRSLGKHVEEHRARIDAKVMLPHVNWRLDKPAKRA